MATSETFKDSISQ